MHKILAAGLASLVITLPATAQTTTEPMPAPAEGPGTPVAPPPPAIPYPAGVRGLNNQTGEQAQLDVAQCGNSASQATGYVPGTTAPTQAAAKPPVGGRAKGAAKGATAGAVVGAVDANNHPYAPDAVRDDYVGDKAGAGAAAGAVAGGMNQRQDRRQSQAEQKQAAAVQSQKATAWQNTYAMCMQGRGYVLEQATAPAS
ncbi:MAG: hypothetical protein ACK57E_06590 [Erythrobacteraceae bacterium]|jgi:hypothetical protein